MKRKFTKLGGALLALLMVPSVAQAADFQNFSVIVNNQSGTILSSTEMAAQGNPVSFGVAVDGIGNVSRVEVDDPSSIATITGNFHSDHGMTNFQCVVAVPGNVKITLGNCTYGGHEASYTPEGGSKVTITTSAECWKNGHTSVTEAYYDGSATTLTIKGAGYTPYFAIETSAYVPNNKTATFSIGGTGAEGVVPAAVTKDIKTDDKSFTIPANFTLYKEGYTLTGWNDGSNTYNVGDTYTIADDVTLTPVFTANTVSLNDRTAATTVTWDFQSQNGAPKVGWESASGDDRLWIAQATVNGQAIDVKMELDANPGKFNNISWVDWCQINSGTTFTIPAAKGMTINVISMSNQTTSFGGDTSYSGYDESNNITYTYTGAASSLDIVIGNGSYFRTITAVYPAPATVVIPVGSLLHATYYNGTMALTLPANLEAATVDGETSGALTLNWRYGEGDVIPAGTPVILKATTATDYTLTEKIGDATAAPAGNYLYGSDIAVTTTGGGTGAKYYALQDGTNGLGFYWMAAEGAAFTSGAHKAWLALPAATPAPFFSLFNDMQTTSINDVRSKMADIRGDFFDLQGRKVANPTNACHTSTFRLKKGLYIVNGKKVAIK